VYRIMRRKPGTFEHYVRGNGSYADYEVRKPPASRYQFKERDKYGFKSNQNILILWGDDIRYVEHQPPQAADMMGLFKTPNNRP